MHHCNFKFWVTVFWDGMSTCTFYPKDEGNAFLENNIYVSDMQHVTCQNTLTMILLTCSQCRDCSPQYFDMVWYCMWIPIFEEHHFLCSLLTLSVKITWTWWPQSEHSW